MLTREESIDLVRRHVSKETNVKHMLAVGAVMRSLAIRLGEDIERWEMVGILHDIDYEVCDGMTDHTIKAGKILAGLVEEEDILTIQSHNYENTGVRPDNSIRKGLIASDAVSGLVSACALVMPSKRLSDVKVSSIVKKFNTKDFAKGVDRSRVMVCSELGLSLEEFLEIGLEGMRFRSEELGL
jgi:predicted hydrolase (HD superfamily)